MDVTAATQAAYAALAAGHYPAAEHYARQILARAPTDRAALTVLAKLALINRLPDTAVSILNSVLATPPQIPATYIDLAQAYIELQLYADAKASLKRALALEKTNLTAVLKLAGLETALGEKEAAGLLFREALTIDPDAVDAIRGLCQLGELSSTAPELAHCLENTLNKATPSDQAKLYYAIAQLYKREKNRHKFIEHLNLALDCQRKLDVPDSLNTYKRMYAQLDDALAHDKITTMTVADAAEPTPIFILGMPRSGSSLTERILANHPAVRAGGELDLFKGPIKKLAEQLSSQPFPAGLEALDREQITLLANSYNGRVAKIAQGARYITDKTPGNHHILGLLPKLFPNCKIIHTERNPMDTCFSILQQAFDEKSPHTFNIELLAESYAQYKKQMTYWHSLPGLEIHTVSYERLASDPDFEAQKLFKFCQLDWDNKYLTPQLGTAGTFTFSATQVTNKITTQSINAWRQYSTDLAALKQALIKRGIDIALQ